MLKCNKFMRSATVLSFTKGLSFILTVCKFSDFIHRHRKEFFAVPRQLSKPLRQVSRNSIFNLSSSLKFRRQSCLIMIKIQKVDM